MPVYMLDTNIVIYINRRKDPSLLARFHAMNPHEAVMSVITLGELHFGAEKSARRDEALETLKEIVAMVPVAAMPKNAGACYGDIRAKLETIGKPIGANDLWIAAHAMCADLTLVTNNLREFDRVKGLRVANWA